MKYPIKIHYFSRTNIPSRHANSIQTAHMASALAKNCSDVDLYIPYKFHRLFRYFFGKLFSPYGIANQKNLRVKFVTGKNHRSIEYHNNVTKKFFYLKNQFILTRNIEIAEFFIKKNAVIFESHIIDQDQRFNRYSIFIDSINKSSSSAIVAISENIRQRYIENGLHSEKVHVLPDGVDFKRFTGAPIRGIKNYFPGLSQDNLKCVFTGSLRPEHGIEWILEAARRFTGIDFLLFGGKSTDVKHWKSRQRSENIHIHTSIPNKYIPSLLREADVLLMPYRTGTEKIENMSPLKMFEYLASGSLIVSPDLPILSPFMIDRKTALTYKNDSFESFLHAIDLALSLSEIQKKDIKTNQMLMARKYSWDARALKMLRLFYLITDDSSHEV